MKIEIPKRVEQHIISKSDSNYIIIKYLCKKSKNVYNLANYYIRQNFILKSKLAESKELEITQQECIRMINEKIVAYNENKIILSNKKQSVDNEEKKVKQFDVNNKYLNFDIMAFIMKDTDAYKILGSGSSQQVLKVLDQNWQSFFESIKKYSANKESFLGRPKLPNYKNTDHGEFNLILTNQQFKIMDGYIYFTWKPLSALNNTYKTNINNKVMQIRFKPQLASYLMEIVYDATIGEPKEFNNRIAGIDLGINNFATIGTNCNVQPIIINGKIVKSINQYYNKTQSEMKSELKTLHNKDWGNKLQLLTNKRNNKVKDFMHKASKMIMDYCIENDIHTLIVGKNKGWKQEVSIGKVNNQKFVQIPYNMFISQLKYKCENHGINFIEHEESYTSRASFLDGDDIPTYNKDEDKIKNKFSGRRVTRGMYKSNNGTLINADLNGAYNIIRKVFPNAFANGIEGVGLHPIKVNIT